MYRTRILLSPLFPLVGFLALESGKAEVLLQAAYISLSFCPKHPINDSFMPGQHVAGKCPRDAEEEKEEKNGRLLGGDWGARVG